MAGSGAVTLKLLHPIQFGSETIEELTFRRPKGKDLRNIKNGTNDSLMLLGKLCGKPDSVIDEMDALDIAKASEIIEGFMGSGPTPPTAGAPTP